MAFREKETSCDKFMQNLLSSNGTDYNILNKFSKKN